MCHILATRYTHTEAETIKGPKLHFPAVVSENPLLKDGKRGPKYKVQNATFTLLRCNLHELLHKSEAIIYSLQSPL